MQDSSIIVAEGGYISQQGVLMPLSSTLLDDSPIAASL